MNKKILDTNWIKDHIASSISVKTEILNNIYMIDLLKEVSDLCLDSLSGNKIILAGNGGSAADAQHIAAEFVSRFKFDRPGLPSISLATDTSILTAIGNDYGYEHLFSRQLESLGNSGDVFIGITTSGNSENILNAFKTANDMSMTTIALTGCEGGKIGDLAKYKIIIPSNSTAFIQESHIMIGHIICGYIEESMFS